MVEGTWKSDHCIVVTIV